MEKTNWKPTEEELISLGFDKSQGFEYVYVPNWDYNWIYLGFSKYSRFALVNDGVFAIHPKSLEELRSLISMMNP